MVRREADVFVTKTFFSSSSVFFVLGCRKFKPEDRVHRLRSEVVTLEGLAQSPSARQGLI